MTSLTMKQMLCKLKLPLVELNPNSITMSAVEIILTRNCCINNGTYDKVSMGDEMESCNARWGGIGIARDKVGVSRWCHTQGFHGSRAGTAIDMLTRISEKHGILLNILW